MDLTNKPCIIQGTGDEEILPNELGVPVNQRHDQAFGFQQPILYFTTHDHFFAGQQIRVLTNLPGKFAEAYIQTKIPPGSCD